MAPDEKPYRVYRGGRQKGKVPAAVPTRTRPKPKPKGQAAATDNGGRYKGPTTAKRPFLKRIRWRRVIVIGLIVLIALVAAWAITGYLAFSKGVHDANKRLPHSAKAALTPKSGLLLSTPTNILLLGTDSAAIASRKGDHHSDSIMIVRTDPKHHRLSYLSIPRDLYIDIPGVGNAKINAAYQAGGAALAIKTIHDYTGIPINHVVVVDFNSFEQLIDAEGGVTINVPEKILSNRFDCPYSARRCESWPGWRFAKGPQHMSGHRALIYARIRENQLNPRDSDITRGARQQAVIQAATSNLTSVGTLAGVPFDGGKLMKPLTTDLSAAQLIQLGWEKFRANGKHALYCRLGGDATFSGGQSVILPSEDNRNVLSMWAGQSAPQPPTSTYGPGCQRGHPLQ
jgi:polyisoprenyl-teichoic acid--peptidoglycan teichoic acid transferase